MKNIENYKASKYENDKYREVEEDIYIVDDESLYLTSLSFEQEPELGEGSNPSIISQYPLEDILDEFYCHINDFYKELNVENSEKCYLEFASTSIDDIKKLRSIIGKRIVNDSLYLD